MIHSTLSSPIARQPHRRVFQETVPPSEVSVSSSPQEQVTLSAQAKVVPAEPSGDDCQTTELFRKAFFEDYQAARCGDNVRRFLTRFPEEALEGASVLGIENKGFSMFGLTRALHARDQKFSGEDFVTDRNWYHHVILEKDGKIFDMDFGIQPQAPTTLEYFETMFLQGDKQVRPSQKLKDYHIQVIDAGEYLRKDGDTSVKMSLAEYGESRGWGEHLQRYLVTAK